MTDQQRERWHVGMVPILAFSLALLAQTGTIFWWAASTTARLKEVETKQATYSGRIDQLGREQSLVAVAAGRLEERLASQAQSLGRIERLLEQIQERP